MDDIRKRFFNAIAQNDKQEVQELLQKYPQLASTRGSNNRTPLTYAVRKSQDEAILDILLPISDLEARCGFDRTALGEAILCEKTSFVQKLIDAGANPDTIIHRNMYHLNYNGRHNTPRKCANDCLNDEEILAIINDTHLKPASVNS